MTQFQTIKFKGFEAQVVARVTDGCDTGIVYLEMAGSESAVKAIWAALSSAEAKRSGTNGVGINANSVWVQKHTKYITLKSVLPNGQTVIGMLNPQATVTQRGGQFYLVALRNHEGPPPAFFSRLAISLAVPVKVEWASWLWKKGLEHGEYEYQKLIQTLTSDGHVVGYKVKASDTDAWLKLVQESIGFKVCERCNEVVKELIEHKTIIGRGMSYQREKVEMICQECSDG